MNDEIKYIEFEKKLYNSPPDEIEKVLSEFFNFLGIK